MLTDFPVLKCSGANFTTSGFLIFAPILISEELQLSVIYSLSTILYILNRKKLKKVFRTLKIKTIFLYLGKNAVLIRLKIKQLLL